MKSLRLLAFVFILAAVSHSLTAADKDTQKSKASPSPKASASPSATPDKTGLPDPVAIVEGKKIKRSELEAEFNNELQQSGQTADSLTADQKLEGYHYVLEDMIVDWLLRARSADVKVTDDDVAKSLQELKAQVGSGSDADFEAAIKKTGMTLDKIKENIRTSLQQRKWIDSQIAGKIDVTEADAKSFYDKHPDQFQEPESIRVSHILIMIPKDASPAVIADKQKLAQAAKDRITKGEDFAKVAGEVSEDTDSKDKGGDLVDFFSRGSMPNIPPEFEEAAFKLKKGEVSDPVKTKLGWHIIKVTDIKDAKTIAYADVKDRLIEYLKDDKKKQAVNDLLQTVRDKADAKVFLPPLPKGATQQDDQGPGPDEGATMPGGGPAPGGGDAPLPPDQSAPPGQ